jgi:hypothetical protein
VEGGASGAQEMEHAPLVQDGTGVH